jgi:hypothetical protein
MIQFSHLNQINQFTIVPNDPNILNKTNEPVYHLNQKKIVHHLNKMNQCTK